MLAEIFKAFLITSIAGSALTAAITLLKPVTKRIFGYSWHYYIWLAVLFVMIVPVRFSLPQSSADIPVVNTQAVQTENITEAVQANTANAGQIANPANTITAAQKATDFIGKILDNRMNYLGIIWLLGAAFMLITSINGYIRLIMKIRRNSVIISCPEASIYTDKKITVRSGRELSSPFMLGIFRPTLVLPDRELNSEQLDNILRHEMTHFRRKDILYKWFTLLVRSVHWFNPLVYYVARQISNECEISCDLSVVSQMNDDEQLSYVNTILSLASSDRVKRVPLTTQMASGKKALKRRFTMIKNVKKTSKFMSVLSAVIAAVMLGSTVFASGVVNEYINKEEPVEVFIDGSRLTDTYTNTPFWKNNTPYLPLRETCNIFVLDNNIISWGFDEEFNTNFSELNIPYNYTNIDTTLNCLVYINRNEVIINGISHLLNQPAILKENITYVPYEFFQLIVDIQKNDGSSKLFDNLYVYDKNGNVIDQTEKNLSIESTVYDSDGTVIFESENLKDPQSTVNGFFKAFAESDFILMKNYCTEECINTYLGDGYCFGMTRAELTNMDIDWHEYLKSSNDFNVFVTVNMTPHEISVFDEGETSASFYVILQRQPNGRFLIDKFATGL